MEDEPEGLVVGRRESRRRRVFGSVFCALCLVALGVGVVLLELPWAPASAIFCLVLVGWKQTLEQDLYGVFVPAASSGYIDATVVVREGRHRSREVVRLLPEEVETWSGVHGWRVVLARHHVVVWGLTRRRAEAYVDAIRRVAVVPEGEVAPRATPRAGLFLASPRSVRPLVRVLVSLGMGLLVASFVSWFGVVVAVGTYAAMLVGLVAFEWVAIEITGDGDHRTLRYRRRNMQTATAEVERAIDRHDVRWVRGPVWWLEIDGERIGWCLVRTATDRELAKVAIVPETLEANTPHTT
ncbi:MAG: hypothetical protein H6722_30345 [Sandaracinus sp.]|nr:hypothetical protein [Myxococcales bacterium]MCB9616757.1 hypothetical protein [Sandaracinus sp.]